LGRSDNVNKGAIDSGGIDADVEDAEFAQQLARALLSFFLGGIVSVWEEW